MKAILRAIALVVCLLPGYLSANEAAIRKALEPKLGGARIEAVQPAPVRGLYEVRLRTAEGIQILYTDAEARHVIQGNIYDLRSGRDLTEERLRKLSAIDFGTLPLEQAVKIQRALQVNATPTLIFANDERYSGGLSIPQLEERLDHATSR